MEIHNVQARTHGRVLVRRAAAPAGMIVGYHGYMENAEIHMDRLAALPGADKWTLVSVQALHRFYHARTETVVCGWMTWQDRELAIVDNIWYVDAALETVHPDPSHPLVHVGYSQGAAMAFRAGVRGRRHAAGIVSVGGDVPPELLEDAAAKFPPVLLLRGAGDQWYTQGKFDEDVEALRARHVPLDARVYQGTHEWNADVAEVVAGFLSQLPWDQAPTPRQRPASRPVLHVEHPGG
jgi:predicted esterase